MYDDAARKVDPWEVDQRARCDHFGKHPTKKASRAGLERWKVLADIVMEWLRSDGTDDAAAEIASNQLADFDTVTRDLIGSWFTGVRRVIHPDDGELDSDPVRPRVTDEAGGRYLTVPLIFALDGESGREEVRLVTGSRGTTPLEAAIFYSDGEEDVELFDMRASSGELTPIDPPEHGPALIEEMFEQDATLAAEPKGPPSPGLHCFLCPSAMRCGEYPLISDGSPRASTRTVTLSRSNISDLTRCERRVAWQKVHGIPKEDEREGYGSSVGSTVHEIIAAHLSGSSPKDALDAARQTCPPDQWSEIAYLFDQHLVLWDQHPALKVIAVEREIGFGGMMDDPHESGDGAVVMIGRPDANGWESETTAAVVEWRTGNVAEPYPLESEFYAVAAWEKIKAMGRALDQVAVHHHFLRPETPLCERRIFSELELIKAKKALAEAGRTALSWDPNDPSQPPYTVGDWCTTCPFENRCKRHRGDSELQSAGNEIRQIR
ncbi:MAG: hypothetical protein GEU79_13360 [Acidimicrobiia bacterium]|nr:hypothetical protein [Acidimicrobiia bacterium]